MDLTTTIPPGWSPDASCQNDSDFWVWSDSVWPMGILGPPDQTSSCNPPDFTPTLGQLYAANSCPDGFTPACTTNHYSSSWSTLCCPTAQSYSCDRNYKTFWSWTAACVTSLDNYTTYITNTFTSFGKSARSTDGSFTARGLSLLVGSSTTLTNVTTTGTFSYVTTYETKQSLWAFAVPIAPPSQTSTSSVSSSSFASATASETTSSPSTTNTSTTGLSAGASAGIAIGAIIGVICIALGVWLFCRRRVTKRGAVGDTEPTEQQSPPGQQQPKPPAQWRHEEYIPQRSPVEVHDGGFRGYELDVTRHSELP